MDMLLKIDGEQLEYLAERISALHAAGDLRTFRIAVDADTLKVKFNEFTWSPPLGEATVGEAAG